MKKHRPRRESSGPQLQMAAMIDVVFLLLVFFVFTIKPVDLLADLSVARPQPQDMGGEPQPELLRISVLHDGLVVNGTRVSLGRLDKVLSRAAEFASRASVIITCAPDSSHSHLIQVLDICSKTGMTNIVLMTAR